MWSRKSTNERETDRLRSLWTLHAQEADSRTESCHDLALALWCPSAEISVSVCVRTSVYLHLPQNPSHFHFLQKDAYWQWQSLHHTAKKHHTLPAVYLAPSLSLLKATLKPLISIFLTSTMDERNCTWTVTLRRIWQWWQIHRKLSTSLVWSVSYLIFLCFMACNFSLLW